MTSKDPMAEILEEMQCRTDNNAFQSGEEIRYTIYYNWNFVWLSAGEVVFRVNDTADMYHFSAIGRTYPSYEWFFKVRDEYHSYVDRNTLLPIIFEKHIEEGNYVRYNRLDFDRKKQRVTYKWGKSRADAETKVVSVDECLHDMLSIVYLMRNLPTKGLEKGDNLPIEIFVDKDSYPLQVEIRGYDDDKKIKGLGRFRTMEVAPQVIAGEVFNEDTEMKVWVSNDRNRIPLLIESPVSVGSIKAVLKNYKGLKYKLSSEIK